MTTECEHGETRPHQLPPTWRSVLGRYLRHCPGPRRPAPEVNRNFGDPKQLLAEVERRVHAATNAYLKRRDSRVYEDTPDGRQMRAHSDGMMNGAVDMDILVERILVDMGAPGVRSRSMTGDALCAEILGDRP